MEAVTGGGEDVLLMWLQKALCVELLHCLCAPDEHGHAHRAWLTVYIVRCALFFSCRVCFYTS